MGKTALSLNLAMQIAMGGTPEQPGKGPKQPIGFFSLEMSKGALAQRLISAQSRVNSHKMRSGRCSVDEIQALVTACEQLADAPIYIDDTPALTVLMLRARARRMVAQYGIKAIFIDYLQLMTAPGASKDGRQNEVAAISRGIKALARELSMPVICLSQLNRGPESRESNRPRMSDLRESGSIEQDADVVMLLHREEYYHVGDDRWREENEDKIGMAEIIIAQQRNGPTGTVELKWASDTTRFKNYAGHATAPAYGNTYNSSAGYSGGGYGGGGYGGGGAGGGGGGGYGAGYGQPAAPASPQEMRVPVQNFSPGRKSGPISDHRDGGGPDRDVIPPPPDDEYSGDIPI